MVRSLLVPLDGTPQAACALAPARHIADATHASMVLLRVAEEAGSRSAYQCRTYLEPIADELRQAGLRVEIAVRQGEPAMEIVLEQRERGSNLVVMATHARSNRSLGVLMSVAERLLAQSSVPLLLVRPGGVRTSRLETFVVPVDGSPGSTLGLAAAVGLARATRARIVLVQVVVPFSSEVMRVESPALTLGEPVDPAWQVSAVSAARTYVDGLVSWLQQAGIEARGRVSVGQVAEEITRCASDVDANLVVMSTHALKWPTQAYIGSAANAVLRVGDRPVLLVRREPSAGDVEDGPAASARAARI
jgi:nucleotide-binding universal stress UspA family protein